MPDTGKRQQGRKTVQKSDKTIKRRFGEREEEDGDCGQGIQISESEKMLRVTESFC